MNGPPAPGLSRQGLDAALEARDDNFTLAAVPGRLQYR
jgi:hypothetical protein